MDVTISQVVKGECFCVEVLTYTSHLDSVLGVAGAAISVAWP